MRYNQILTKEYLAEKHEVLRMTGLEIADEIGCTMAYVCMMMKSHGMPNMSNSFKRGVPNTSKTKFTKGHRPWNTGIPTPSPNKGKKFPRQEMHWNWKGGAKSEKRAADPRYRDWRTEVFQRDDYTCVFCGMRGGMLNADHIEPWAIFPEKRYDLNNGRTLCVPCHRNTPTYGARTRSKVLPLPRTI